MLRFKIVIRQLNLSTTATLWRGFKWIGARLGQKILAVIERWPLVEVRLQLVCHGRETKKNLSSRRELQGDSW